MDTVSRFARPFALVSLLAATAAGAAPLPVYNPSYLSPNAGCATYGNFVSCSTRVLDYLTLLDPLGFPGPYSFAASQGSLLDSIVVATNGGNIADNGDQLAPSEDGFSTNNGGQKRYFYTGDDGNDPSNNGTLTGDTPYSWDVGIGALNQKLDGRQLLFAFDFNNPSNSTATLPVWALVTLRDLDGALTNVYFETQQLDLSNPPASIFKDPALHSSTKTFDGSAVSTPGATDFAQTYGSICVINTSFSYPSPDGSSCPNGGTLVSTNQASNAVEWIAYLPSMDLSAYQAVGYDMMSIQVWMGCFGGNNVPGAGPALAGGGSVGIGTTLDRRGNPVSECDTGGFGDIFLIAGGPTHETPEPTSLLLAGLGLLGLGLGLQRGGLPGRR